MAAAGGRGRRSASPREPIVDGVTDEGVAEAEPERHRAQGRMTAAATSSSNAAEDVANGHLADLHGQPDVERVTDHRGAFQQGVGPVRQQRSVRR